MQYKFLTFLSLACTVVTFSFFADATDENDLRREENAEYVCDTLKEDCSEDQLVTVGKL